jgi:GNAT superfamily N-acetyltransferase
LSDRTSPVGPIIREATRADVPAILALIKELADYEKLSHIVEATEESLSEVLFGERPVAEALIAFHEGEPAGYAIFFHSVSTFLGRAGIYLEDLYVRPHLRGKGIGKALFAAVARIARDRNSGRLEWQVLRWNSTAIDFYDAHGAESLDGWVTMRLAGDALDAVAAGDGER